MIVLGRQGAVGTTLPKTADAFEEVANAVRFVQAVLGGEAEEWLIEDGLAEWDLEASPENLAKVRAALSLADARARRKRR
jgi:hypothetical protein